MVATLELAHLAVAGSELPPLAFAHAERLDHTRVEPVENISWAKPSGGLWLSRRTAATSSTWTDFLSQEWKARLYSAPLLVQPVSIAPEARFLCIASLDALREVVSAYLLMPDCDYDFFQNLIDFERLAQDFSGIYLTEEGQWATRRPGPGMPTLYGWDLESVLVFDPSVVTPA